jgi:hypothetical protein
MTRLRSCAFQIVGTLVFGALLTSAWIGFISLDPFNRWQATPPLPAPDAQVVDMMHYTVFVRAVDGQLYELRLTPESDWTPTSTLPTPNESGAWRTRFGACDRTDQRFAWYKGVPADSSSCVEAMTMYADGSFTASVIQDRHNVLYYYVSGGSSYGREYAMIGMIITSLGVGYCVTRIFTG